MSYSFSAVGDSKILAGKAVEAELSKVVSGQPVHERDRQMAQDAAEAAIGMLVEPSETESVRVNVSGSLGWRAENEFTSANISVTAHIARND